MKIYVMDTKILVLFMLSMDSTYKSQFEECALDSNVNEKEAMKILRIILNEILSGKATLCVTPQILAEFSNWIKKYVEGKRYKMLMESIIDFLQKNCSEYYVKMHNILKEKEILIKFGFTDTSIYIGLDELNKSNNAINAIIITSDRELYDTFVATKILKQCFVNDKIYAIELA